MSANSSSSPLSLAPIIMVELFPAEESRLWTGATEAVPPITASSSVKNEKSDVVVRVIPHSSSC